MNWLENVDLCITKLAVIEALDLVAAGSLGFSSSPRS